MTILTNLFGESPFGVLEAHAEKVHSCVKLLREVFAHLKDGNGERLREIAMEIARLETEADALQNRAHELLASRVLLPIGKTEFFSLIEQQDSMADRAEDIAATLTYREMSLPGPLMNAVLAYVENVIGTCELAAGMMSRLDLLVESSFRGRDALTISKLATELAEREDRVKVEQIEVTRRLLADEAQIPPVEALLWVQVLGLLGALSKAADHTGNGLRMTLQIKDSK